MELTVVSIVKPDAANFIFGQSHLSRPWKTSTRRWWARFQASASG